MAESTWIELLEVRLQVDRILAFVSGDPALGGIVSFFGATRGESDEVHGPLLRLEYEAYRSMALNQLEELTQNAMRRWGAGRVAILHRLGPVGVGECSVAIAVACPHRAEAFEACRWLIDELKREVPIWKKDVFADGAMQWVEPDPNEQRA